ncbi:MAG: substrate-binding domain-containing protein [Solirubrobacteraceae bacterium]
MTFRAFSHHREGLAALLAASALLGLAACGGGSGSSGPSGTKVSLEEPKSGCGSVPVPAVQDPDGVVAQLPAEQKAAYEGYAYPVHKSMWSDWKPDDAGPYDVGVVWGPSTAGFQVDMGEAVVDRLKSSPLIGDVDFRSMGADVNIPVALSNFNAFIAKGVDLIIAEPLLGPSFVPVVKKAAAEGIPVVTVQTAVDTPEAVNVSPNLTLAYAQSTARLLRIIGGKGNVMAVRGIPGSPPDTEAAAAWKTVLDECPNVKQVGEAYGNFIDVNAKSETLKFLATHPQKIDGVIQSGTMTGGIMGAFQQSGRPMPVVDDVGPMKASTGYWLNNKGSYNGVGMAFGPRAMGSAGASVALRMLEGQGPKLSNIIARMTILTEENLGDWGDKASSLTTPGQPEGPADTFFTEDYIDAFFARPATPKGS